MSCNHPHKRLSNERLISTLGDRARLILLEREVEVFDRWSDAVVLGGGSRSTLLLFLFFTYSFISQTHAVTVLLMLKIEQGFETQESDHKNTALRQRGVAASCRSMEHLSLTHQSG